MSQYTSTTPSSLVRRIAWIPVGAVGSSARISAHDRAVGGGAPVEPLSVPGPLVLDPDDPLPLPSTTPVVPDPTMPVLEPLAAAVLVEPASPDPDSWP
jgi:hypothetical protein